MEPQCYRHRLNESVTSQARQIISPPRCLVKHFFVFFLKNKLHFLEKPVFMRGCGVCWLSTRLAFAGKINKKSTEGMKKQYTRRIFYRRPWRVLLLWIGRKKNSNHIFCLFCIIGFGLGEKTIRRKRQLCRK